MPAIDKQVAAADEPAEKWLVVDITFHRDFTINNGTVVIK